MAYVMDFDRFEANRSVYGQCSSGAVWTRGACEQLRYEPDPGAASGFHLNTAIQRLNKISSQRDLNDLGWPWNPNGLRPLVALHDSECADPSMQLPGVNQTPHDIVAQIPQPQSDAAQVLQPAVDRLDRTAGCADIEVGQYVLASAPQGTPQFSELLQPAW